ncbi:MAG: DNA recombination protein RmuC [Crocinitomicaceae bacterium]|nr:DNA recombination protein RmuC [Crocinitomicaceae bacterium]MDC0098717.1 DNA recombination protein RmuC [Crocinitomicaceae bacterium]MDC1196092.1 DNA recombination protein RmuC [Crocinitomicaceae bacterium]|tara:strand:- start:2655 stop:3974 length:1320 start_codon:yes stop_codon:yes gene_type:complete
MDYILLVIGLVAGGIIGFLAAKLIPSSTIEAGDSMQQLKINNATLENSTQNLRIDLESSKTDLSQMREAHQNELKSATEWKSRYNALEEKIRDQKEELESLQEKFTKEFELVANKILDEKTSKFTDQNKKNLDVILNPLKEKISEFQKKVEDNNEKSIERSATLDKHLKMLRDLNQEITQETRSLTQALRGDSKVQGNWGEMQLETILEKAGLQKDIHYSKETNLKTEDGSNQRLDYIINLPDGKNLILDSKVSLTAYSNYHDTDNKDQKALYLKQHLDSINGHLKLLGGKDYQKLHDINSPDYVLMFVANEPALTLALREDQGLFEKALDKNIVIVSISTLLATLRTISYIWKQDLQNKNAEEIARQAGNLYDKFVGFTDDLLKLGSQMDTASKTYKDAMNKMVDGSGNLTKRIQDLKKLGVNPSKEIDGRLIDKSES